MTEMTREEMLVHFGKRGMRWGVRNAEDAGNSYYTESPRDGSMSGHKKAALIGGGVLAVAGIAAVAIVMKNSGMKPMSTISKASEVVNKGSGSATPGRDGVKANIRLFKEATNQFKTPEQVRIYAGRQRTLEVLSRSGSTAWDSRAGGFKVSALAVPQMIR
jgi:hypothetical protein